MKRIGELLAEVPAFVGLAEEQRELIGGCGRNVVLRQGDYVFREGDPANVFYAIRSGSVALELGAPATLIIETLHPGDVLGWSWLFPPYRVRYDARAMEDVHAIAFDGACLRQKCDADHDLGYELMRRFAQIITARLQATRLRLLDVLRRPAHRGPVVTIADVPERFRVSSSRQETEDTWTLKLEPVERQELGFAPGQFTMLYAFGAGEVPISVSGDPGRPRTLVHTVRAVGAATRAVCAANEGEELGVRGPFGRGWPLAEAEGRDVVVVAGGVGLAPLRSVLYAVLADRERYGRLVLLYGGRTPDQLLYRDELSEWADRDDVEVRMIVDAADEGWRGRVGVVPALVEQAGLDGAQSTAMVCGPEVMMRFAVEALVAAALPAERIFLSMERNMKCAVGHCGHCQWGPSFVCRDGPVYSWSEAEPWFRIREL